MDAITIQAEEVLRQHPAPAMALIELQRRLHERRPGLAPSCDSLRVLMENSPHRFRVLDPWRRPWSERHDERHTEAADVLVMTITIGASNDGRLATDARLRESVRWIARGVDLRSPRSLARLYALLLAERSTRPRLSVRAA